MKNSYERFLKALSDIKKFMDEQDELYYALKVISPSSTGVCEFGNDFIESYIKYIEDSFGDECNWLSWFIFENNFGREKRFVIIDEKKHIISSPKIFYNTLYKPLFKG